MFYVIIPEQIALLNPALPCAHSAKYKSASWEESSTTAFYFATTTFRFVFIFKQRLSAWELNWVALILELEIGTSTESLAVPLLASLQRFSSNSCPCKSLMSRIKYIVLIYTLHIRSWWSLARAVSPQMIFVWISAWQKPKNLRILDPQIIWNLLATNLLSQLCTCQSLNIGTRIKG